MAQVGTGALSDRKGRRPLLVSGMILQAMGLAITYENRSDMMSDLSDARLGHRFVAFG
jgi:hypothetical protein